MKDKKHLKFAWNTFPIIGGSVKGFVDTEGFERGGPAGEISLETIEKFRRGLELYGYALSLIIMDSEHWGKLEREGKDHLPFVSWRDECLLSPEVQDNPLLFSRFSGVELYEWQFSPGVVYGCLAFDGSHGVWLIRGNYENNR